MLNRIFCPKEVESNILEKKVGVAKLTSSS